MSPAALPLVVDASVGIKVFLVEPFTDRAQALFDRLSENPPAVLHVPGLFYIECASTLRKAVHRYGYPAGDARKDLAALRRLSIRIHSSVELAEDALALSLSRGITVYDASYVALSDRLRLPLVTADERLVSDLAGTPHDVRFIGAFEP